MKLFFVILKSSFTDRLAYLSAVAGALCWLIHAWYPTLFPGELKETAHIYTTLVAALAAGLMMAKYVLMEGYLQSMQTVQAEKEVLAAAMQRLEGSLLEIQAEKERIAERESALMKKLKSLESSSTEAQLSSLRKKIRTEEEDRKTALDFLTYELRNRLQELDTVKDGDIAHAVAVLKKETHLLENEIKKGERSLYELALSISEIQKHIYDLTSIKLQSGSGEQEDAGDPRQPGYFPWFDEETDPSRIDRIYKFLKVAFHPDRFSSEGLKKEAKIYFQEAGRAYSTLKERFRPSH